MYRHCRATFVIAFFKMVIQSQILIISCVVQLFVTSETDVAISETGKNPFQYLEEQHYPYENHTIITEDDYKLLLVRIPYDRTESSTSNSTRPPILFVHGILSSFYDFLITGPGISFGFRALEEGYDVFLLNARGNSWSRNHVTLDPDLNASQFWNYSFHEVGIYDLPATIDYIINLTGHSKISYVGYSQGTTSFLVLTSCKPDYNNKIKIAVLLAPVAFTKHAEFIFVTWVKDQLPTVEIAAKKFHVYELVQRNAFMYQLKQVLPFICKRPSAMMSLCSFIYDLGGPSSQMNKSLLGSLFVNFPQPSATKQYLHYIQLSHSGKFQQYDYGTVKNIITYGHSTPPDYHLSAVSAPVALYYGDSDHLASIRDVRRLRKKLPKVIRNVLIPYSHTNHFDILMGTRAPELVTEPALKVLNEYNHL